MYRFNEAEETAQKALEQLPQNITILKEKISLYCNQGQYDKAIAICDEILKINLANEDAFVQKIRVLRSLRRFSDAEQAIQEALKQLPRSAEILNQQGDLYATQQRHEAALEAFKEVLSIDPNNVNAFAGKIQALRSQGKRDAANQAIQEMRDRPGNSPEMFNKCGTLYYFDSPPQYEKAVQAFEQTLKDSPDDEDAWEGKIKSLRLLRRFPEAEQAIQEALTRLPRSVRILNHQGYLYADQKQDEAALEVFKQVLSIDSINVEAFNGKIQALRSQGKWDEVNQSIQEMCDRPNNSPEMLNQCGWLYFSQQQYDKAIQVCKQTLKNFPYDEVAWTGKIVSLQWQPDFDKAETVIQEARKWLPRSQQIQALQIRLHLHRRQYDRVIKDCQEILRNNPSHEIALWGTIEALREQSHFEDATRKMDDALRKLQYSVRLLNQKGTLLLSQRYYRKAYWAFGEALKINPTDEGAVIGQIRSKCQGYRFDKAEKIAQKFLQQPALSRSTSILNEQGRL